MFVPLTKEELEAGLDHIRKSPKDNGVLELIVRRPKENEREILEEGQLDLKQGLVGDNWRVKGSSRTTNGLGHPDMQLNVMNARAVAHLAKSKDRWALAGDQLYVDFDLSNENLSAGDQLAIGSAIIEVTEIPHNGCKKFVERFGLEAMKFVNSPIGKELHLRGINAKVVKPGIVKTGDVISKV